MKFFDTVVDLVNKGQVAEMLAGTQGGMKSLWQMMTKKGLYYAVRCSLENFGSLYYKKNSLSEDAVFHVDIENLKINPIVLF